MADVETWKYPSWWASATTVSVVVAGAWHAGDSSSATHTTTVANVEFLPNGISFAADGLLFPWAQIQQVYKAT